MTAKWWQKRGSGLMVLCVTAVLWPTAAPAAEGADEISQLRRQQAELENRINQLEARQKLRERSLSDRIDQVAAAQEEAKPAEIPDVLKWASKLHWSGDFRYRYEYLDDDGADSEDRHRNRIRARLGLGVKLSEEWELGFRLATGQGEVSGDPVSTNQTLDEAFSNKPIWLDLAFFGYHPGWFEGLNVYSGKIENPFYRPGKNQLIWDSDLTPEGGAILYGMPLGEQTTLNGVAGGFWVNEESGGGDTSLWGLQGYLKHQLDKPTYILGGAGLFCYGNLQGEESLADEWDDAGDEFFGNTSAPGDVYAFDYDLFEFFAEFGTVVADLPVAVFADYVRNTVADDEDPGWLAGLQLNKLKDPGSWQLEWDYRDIERDAVVGQFNDSDFIGGGTGGRGHRFAVGYQLAKNVATGVTYYMAEFDRPGIEDENYDRVQVDLALKF